MKGIKLNGTAKAVVGMITAIVIGVKAFVDVRNEQAMEEEFEELKEKVAKLENGRES